MPSRGSRGSSSSSGGGGYGRRPTVVPLRKSSPSSAIPEVPLRESVPWYNMPDIKRRERWNFAIGRFEEDCKGERHCSEHWQRFIELLEDCPREMLEKYKIPPIPNPNVKALHPPLKLPDPLSTCRYWKSVLKECTETNSHYDARWRCAPCEGCVEDHCGPKA